MPIKMPVALLLVLLFACSALFSAAAQDNGDADDGQAQERKANVDSKGDALPPGAVARLGTIRYRHPGLEQFVFAPDGKSLYSAGNDQTIRTFDVATGLETRQFSYDEKYVTFAPDAKRVALFTREGQIRFCDPATGKELARLKVHPVPDGNPGLTFLGEKGVVTASLSLGFTGGGDGLLYFFDIARGQETMQIGEKHTPKEDAYCIAGRRAISPDGTLLATGRAYTPAILLWDTRNGKLLHSVKIPRHANALAFSPDGKTLACGYDNSFDVVLWETLTLQERARLCPDNELPKSINMVTFAPAGNLLAAMSDSGKVWVWDLLKSKVIFTIPEEPLSVPGGRRNGPIFSPKGDLVAVGLHHAVGIWEAKTGKRVGGTNGSMTQAVLQAVLTPDGQTAITRDFQSIRLWDIASGKENQLFGMRALQMGLSSDGRYLATLAANMRFEIIKGEFNHPKGVHHGPLTIWDLRKGAQPREIDLGKTTSDVVFAKDLSTIAIVDHLHKIALWDVGTGNKIQQWQEKTLGEPIIAPDGAALAYITSGLYKWKLKSGKAEAIELPEMNMQDRVHFSTDGKFLGCWSPASEFRVYDIAKGKITSTTKMNLPSTAIISGFVLLADGKTLIFHVGTHLKVPNAGSIEIWDVSTGVAKASLKNVTGPWEVFPDGKKLAGATGDGKTLAVWDLSTTRQLATFNGHRGKITSLAINRNNRALISGSDDCTAIVWEMK